LVWSTKRSQKAANRGPPVQSSGTIGGRAGSPLRLGATLAVTMPTEPPSDPERFFAGHPLAAELYRHVRSTLEAFGSFEVRTAKTQVAFRRRRGFAYLWFPVEWARRPGVEVVLSVSLPREDDSPRWKQVAHPSPCIWMHHLELSGVADLDTEARDWLAEAYEAAH
jgi:hypothetical protein